MNIDMSCCALDKRTTILGTDHSETGSADMILYVVEKYSEPYGYWIALYITLYTYIYIYIINP